MLSGVEQYLEEQAEAQCNSSMDSFLSDLEDDDDPFTADADALRRYRIRTFVVYFGGFCLLCGNTCMKEFFLAPPLTFVLLMCVGSVSPDISVWTACCATTVTVC